MSIKGLPKLNWYIVWIAFTTVAGTIIEFTVADNPEKHITIPLIWFFTLGVVPALLVWVLVKLVWFARNRGRARESMGAHKKTLMIGIIVLVVALIAINWLLYNTVGLLVWEMFETQHLSEGEVKAKAGTFTRNYPDVIKGNWEPNAWHMERLLMRDSDRLKAMGVNTVSISVDYTFRKDGTYYVRDEDKVMSNLVRAKEKGFAVLLAPNFVGAETYDFKKKGTPMTKDEFLRISEEVALKWAKIAEEYQVEFFTPQSEIDGMVQVNFAGDGTWNERFPEMARITGEWHKKMLPQIREIFGGKVMPKIGLMEKELAARPYYYSGYDTIGTASCHNNLGLKEARRKIAENYILAESIAEKTNSSWAVLEGWYPIGGPFWPVTVNEDGQSLDELHDEYYKISMEEYLKRNRSAGFIFHSWTMPVSPVKDRPAEQVLTDFFSKI